MDFLTKVQANDQMQEVDQEEKKEQEGMDLKLIIKELVKKEVAQGNLEDIVTLVKAKVLEIELEKQALKSNSEELKEITIEFKVETENLIKKLIEDATKHNKETTKKLVDSNTMLMQKIEDKQLFENLEKNINNSLKSYVTNVEKKTSSKIAELESKIEEYEKITNFLNKTVIGIGIALVVAFGVIIYFYINNSNEINRNISDIYKYLKAEEKNIIYMDRSQDQDQVGKKKK